MRLLFWGFVGVIVTIVWAAVLSAIHIASQRQVDVVIYSHAGDIYIDDLRQQRTLPLITHAGLDTYPAPSPDGNHIAFISSRSPTADYTLFALDLRTGEQTEITDIDRYRPQPYDPVFAPQWSPDGTKIAVPVGTGMTVVELANRTGTLFRGEIPLQLARWTIDSKKLTFLASQRNTNNLGWVRYELDVASGEIAEVGNLELHCSAMTKPIAWSPDGQRVAYLCERQVFIYDIEHGGFSSLVIDAAFPDDLMWSPDGGQLLYVDFFVRTPNGVRAGIMTVDVETGQLRQGMMHPADFPVWLP